MENMLTKICPCNGVFNELDTLLVTISLVVYGEGTTIEFKAVLAKPKK